MKTILKYIISGGTAAFVDLFILYVLDSFGMHYLISVNVAFIIAFFVSFGLQKFWTFNDAEEKKIHHQLSIYFLVTIINIFINSLLVHLFLKINMIESMTILPPVVIAQVIASAIIAVESFFVYRFYIFKKEKKHNYQKNKNQNKPRLLIITQKVDMDDPILGFFHRWIEEFAKNCDLVLVICLSKGRYDLPNNVEVLSLGKENGESRLKYLINFYRYIILHRKKYDSVFVHMNPEYIVMGGLLWKVLGRKICLWYTHKGVNMKLKIAEKLSSIIFTASSESFRLKSRKLKIVGHGIDIENFQKITRVDSSIYTILSVARISETKNQLIIIKAFNILKQEGFKGRLVIVGSPVTQLDEAYQKDIVDYVESNNLKSEVLFRGSLRPSIVVEAYQNADLFINLSMTGSLDKAVLEAMACGLQVITSNEAFREIIPEENQSGLSPQEIAEKIHILSKQKTNPSLRQYVVERNDIKNLIPVIISDIVISQ